MPYFRVDDGWWSHPKTLALSPAARDLWVRAGAWSMQHYTDGLISKEALRTLGAKPKNVRELVDVGYWETVLVGHQFHDWHDHQESAESLKDRREKARERMRRLRNGSSGSQDVRANVPRTNSERTQDVFDPSPSHPLTTGLNEESSVLETARGEGPDQQAAALEYVEAGMRLKVDFRKIRARVVAQADGHPVTDSTVWAITETVLDRAQSRAGDRTGVVLTSLKNDWAEWSQFVFRQVTA